MEKDPPRQRNRPGSLGLTMRSLSSFFYHFMNDQTDKHRDHNIRQGIADDPVKVHKQSI